MVKLARATFLQLGGLLLLACGASKSNESDTSGDEPGPAGTGGDAPEAVTGGAGSGTGGSAGASELDPVGGQAGNGAASRDCAARALAADIRAAERMVPMDPKFPNHEVPHEFFLSQAELERVLTSEQPDDDRNPFYHLFDTTSGSGASGTFGVTKPHVHPVLLWKAKVQELLDNGTVQTATAATTDEGGIVHGHVVILRLC